LIVIVLATQRRVAAVAEFPSEAKISEERQIPSDVRKLSSGIFNI
jgi:hypothetical protein